MTLHPDVARGPALLLVVLLLASGFAGCLQGSPPEDPSELDYIFRSDHPDKAPHPVAFEGPYQELGLDGIALTVPVEGPVHIPAPNVDDEFGRAFSTALVLHDAQGTFRADDGDETRFENATVHVTADETLQVQGLEQVHAVHHTFADGAIHMDGAPVPIDSGPLAEARLQVGSAGADVADVQVAIDPDPGPGDAGEPGSLHVEPGNYTYGGGPIEVAYDGTLTLPDEDATVRIEPAGAPVTLRGEDQTPQEVRLDAEQVTGSVDVPADEATLDLQVDQWFEEDRPWFEAAFEARFEEGGTERSVTLEEGENETYWVQGSEVGEVGTAVDMRPQVDDGGIRATFGIAWYEHTDPHPLAEAAAVFGAAFEAFFQDPATRTFEPGQTLYIPFVVGAPNGTDPGDYQVQGWIHGDNAKSDRITVDVTVVEG